MQNNFQRQYTNILLNRGRICALSLFTLITTVLLGSCGGDSSPPNIDIPAAQEKALLQSIASAQIGYTNPNATKTFTVDGYPTIAGVGSIFARFRDDLTVDQAEGFLNFIAGLDVPIIGIGNSGYILQIGTTAALDETALLAKIRTSDAIATTYLYELSIGSASILPGTGTTSDLGWWRTSTGTDIANSIFENRKGALPNASLGVVDADFGSGHGNWVTQFAVGGSTEKRGMWATGKSDQYQIAVPFSNESHALYRAISEGKKVINLSRGSQLPPSDKDKKVPQGFGGFCYDVSYFSQFQSCTSRDAHVKTEQRYRENIIAASLRNCQNNDCLIVKSAGNDGVKDDDTLFSNSNLRDTLLWDDHVIVVGAANKDNQDATFSRMGKVVDILAPGTVITSDVDRGGSSTLRYGTSYAAPLVSGVAGMIRTLAPNLKAGEVKRILVDSASSSTAQTIESLKSDPNFAAPYYVQAGGPNKKLEAVGAIESALALNRVTLSKLAPQRLIPGSTTSVPVTVLRAPVNQIVDILFLFDISGSTSSVIASFQVASNEVLNAVRSNYPNAAFGVATFSDFATPGHLRDSPFRVIREISSSLSDVTSSLAKLSGLGEYGGDEKEAQLDALYQLSTGAGWDADGDGRFSTYSDIKPQSTGWRTGAKRIVVMFTDVDYHDKTLEPGYLGVTYNQAVQAARSAGITLYTMLPGDASGPVQAAYTTLTTALGGQVFLHSLAAPNIISQAISGAVGAAFNKPATVSLKAIMGASQVASISGDVSGVLPGAAAAFNVQLKGTIPRPSFVGDISAPILFWATERPEATAGTAVTSVLGRYEIPVSVPSNLNSLLASTNPKLKAYLNKISGQ